MTLSEMLLPELDQESILTRNMLERVPDEKLDWKPHAKSMSFGQLAGHLAEIPGWGAITITTGELDLAPVGGPQFKPTVFTSRQQMIDTFDQKIAGTRLAIAGASDEDLMKPWTLLMGGKALFTMPRYSVLRGMIFNHSVHHRAQLDVYLRLNDIPVPSTYGGSADEPGF